MILKLQHTIFLDETQKKNDKYLKIITTSDIHLAAGRNL